MRKPLEKGKLLSAAGSCLTKWEVLQSRIRLPNEAEQITGHGQAWVALCLGDLGRFNLKIKGMFFNLIG